ncbi:MAG: copper chaperone PCu(A)C [Hyphomicrobiaceae bacterium]
MSSKDMLSLILSFLFIVCLVPPLVGEANAHGYQRGTLKIVHPWCFDRFEPESRDVVVGMAIESAHRRGDRLLRAETQAAQRVEIQNTDGKPLKYIDIRGKSRVRLGRAEEAHIRLIGLTPPLIAYGTIPLTLVFERAGRIETDVMVEEALDGSQ